MYKSSIFFNVPALAPSECDTPRPIHVDPTILTLGQSIAGMATHRAFQVECMIRIFCDWKATYISEVLRRRLDSGKIGDIDTVLVDEF